MGLRRACLLLPLAALRTGLMTTAAEAPTDRKERGQKPHLIFAMVDDWGFHEVGFRGNPIAQTPFIDKMIGEALLIERHYSFRFCSPARRSFLSGRLPPHVGQTNTADATIDLRMDTIADKLAAAGYATGHSGKWHAGFFTMQQTPHARGFSTSLGFLYGVDHWTQQSFDKVCKYGDGGNSTDLWYIDRPAWGMNGTYGDYIYVGHAVETIMQHNASAAPLFYYLATEVAHMPNEAPLRFLDLYDPETVPFQSVYAMSSIIDESLRNVTGALQVREMWPNTLLVVASDNGGSLTQTRASNYPLRGGKYSWLEGGIRTTAWVTGGVLPPPMRGKNLPSSHLIAVCDWHSTFLALAGVIEPADGKAKGGLSEVQTGGAADSSSMQQRTSSLPRIDSINQWPVISGERTTPLRDEVFVGSGVLISGNYKLIATSNPHDDARWSGPMYPKVPAFGNRTLSCSQRMPCLFDVVQDLREEQDLASVKPQMVVKLQARLATLMQGVFEADPPPEGTQAKLCEASIASGMWITPLASLPPAPPARRPLPGDEWLAFAHQWQVNTSARRIVAKQDRAVLKKECASSTALPTSEVRFFDAGRVITLSSPPKITPMCGAHEDYFEVEAPLATPGDRVRA